MPLDFIADYMCSKLFST